MAKKKGSRANRNWATGGGGAAGYVVGANIGYAVGGKTGMALGSVAGAAAGARIGRRMYNTRHSNPAGSKGRHGGTRRGGGGGRQRRDSHGKFR